jgi:TorA maturation chaperone TorD
MRQKDARIDWATTIMGEKLLFGLLGKILYAEPDKTWLQSLVAQDVFAEIPFGEEKSESAKGLELLQKWSHESGASLSDISFDELRADYMRLFVGIGKVLAPPWESVYFNDARMVFQVQTLQVRDWFHRYGVETEKLHQEPDDHIGLELTFLSHLAMLGLQAIDEKDDIKFEQVLEAQRQFLIEHPLKWVPEWCKLVGEKANTDFYRGLALLVRGTLFSLAEILEIQLLQADKM